MMMMALGEIVRFVSSRPSMLREHWGSKGNKICCFPGLGSVINIRVYPKIDHFFFVFILSDSSYCDIFEKKIIWERLILSKVINEKHFFVLITSNYYYNNCHPVFKRSIKLNDRLPHSMIVKMFVFCSHQLPET